MGRACDTHGNMNKSNEMLILKPEGQTWEVNVKINLKKTASELAVPVADFCENVNLMIAQEKETEWVSDCQFLKNNSATC